MSGMQSGNELFFSVVVEASLGDKVLAVGNLDILGSWQPSAGFELGTGLETYPCWSGVAVLPNDFAQSSKVLEFKFVVLRRDGSLLWEPGENRSLQASRIRCNHVMETSMFGKTTCITAPGPQGLRPCIMVDNEDLAGDTTADESCSITAFSSFSRQSSGGSFSGMHSCLQLPDLSACKTLPAVSFPSPTSMSSPHCITPYSKVYGVHPALFDFNSEGEMVMKVSFGSQVSSLLPRVPNALETNPSSPQVLMQRRKSSTLFES